MILALGLAALLQKSAIDAVLDAPALRGSLVGVVAMDDRGAVLYERNADLRLIPASNQKLLSCAYALHVLGPAHSPRTRIWKTGSAITLDSPGDPSMTTEKLRAARHKLGIRPGTRIYVRQAYRPGYGTGWEWDDLPNRYAPTISAFTIDRAGFELWGSPKRLWIKSEPFGIKIVRHGGTQERRTFDLVKRRLDVFGPLPKAEGFIEAFALPNPDHMAASVLGGPYYRSESFPAREPDLVLEGDSVGKLVAACLPASDNFLAESLLFMAASREGALGDDEFSTAARRLRKFLIETVGLEESEADPYDGSGLSRHNNVTARGIAKLLIWARKQPWADLWAASQAAPGSGTLRNRLKNTGFRGKTGTLNKVSSLSGYCKTKDGRELVVSVILNHYLGPDALARDAQDAIVQILEATHEPTLLPPTVGRSALSLSRIGRAHGDRVPGPGEHRPPVPVGAHH